MATKTNTKSPKKNLKTAAIAVGVIVIVIGALVYMSWSKDRNAKTAAVAQEQKKTQSDSSKSSTSSGGVVDNNSTANLKPATPTPAPSNTTSSAPISLVSPTDGALITSGTTLSGTAMVSTVQYRFKDADGLDVATGALTVAGGKYSGSVAGLNPRTTTGTLEVYNYNANGAEENWVKINVRYK